MMVRALNQGENWSVLDIMLLLHFHALYAPLLHPEAPATLDSIERFLEQGLIEADADPTNESGFRTTRKGQVLVGMFKRVPLPVVDWIDPREGQ